MWACPAFGGRGTGQIREVPKGWGAGTVVGSESFICSSVLVHCPSHVVPFIQVCIGGPSTRHGGHRILDLGI